MVEAALPGSSSTWINADKTYSTTLSYNRNVVRHKGWYANLNSTLSHSNSDTTILFNLSFYFTPPSGKGWSKSIGADYQNSMNSAPKHSYGLVASINRQFNLKKHRIANIQLSSMLVNNQKTLATNLSYKNSNYATKFSYNRYMTKEDTISNYTLNFNTTFLYAQHQFDFVDGSQGNAAIMYYIEARDKGHFEALVNNQSRLNLETNSSEATFIRSFDTLKTNILSNDKFNYDFDNPKESFVFYPGTVKYIPIKIKQNMQLIANFYNINNKPLQNAVIELNDLMTVTDDDGYAQITMPTGTKSLEVKQEDDKSCIVTLPDYNGNDGYAYFEKLTCVPDNQ